MRTVCEQMVSRRPGWARQAARTPARASLGRRCASETLVAAAEYPLTFVPCCGSMLDASAQRGARRRDRADKLPASIPKEPAMRIGEEQEEFEILPSEEEQQPVVLPEREPPPQPEDAPA
jgi:hypothetical protein